MSTITVPDQSDTMRAPLCVVRTRVVRLPAEDLLDTILAALIGNEDDLQSLRNEQVQPEPILETVQADNLEQALKLAADMVAANPQVGDRQRVKIMRQSDAPLDQMLCRVSPC